MERKLLAVRIPVELYVEVRAHSDRTGIKIQALVEHALRAYLPRTAAEISRGRK